MRQGMNLVGGLVLALSLSGPALAGGQTGYAGHNVGGHGLGGHAFGGHGLYVPGVYPGRSGTFGSSVANNAYVARGASNGFHVGGYATRNRVGPIFYRTPGAVTGGYATTRYSYGTPSVGSFGRQRNAYRRFGYRRGGYGSGGYGYGLAGLGLGYGAGSYDSGYAESGYGADSNYGYAGYPTNFAQPGSYEPGGYGQDYGGAAYGLQTGGCTCR